MGKGGHGGGVRVSVRSLGVVSRILMKQSVQMRGGSVGVNRGYGKFVSGGCGWRIGSGFKLRGTELRL